MAEQYWHIVVPYDNNMLVLSYKYGVQMKVREDEDIKKNYKLLVLRQKAKLKKVQVSRCLRKKFFVMIWQKFSTGVRWYKSST